jgi:hypothetical protein
MLEKTNAFDKSGLIRHEVDSALESLKKFRQKFPFTENLRSIEWLDPDKLFKINPDEVGEFFRFLEDYFKPLGYQAAVSSNVYRNARLQINDLKNLLRVAVDSRKSLAQKIDAPWERIGGLGQDKQLAKKIIYCFNYETGTVLPILNNQHLRYFVSRVVDTSNVQTKYFSLGQEYEHYTMELLKTKNNLPTARSWNNLYFARFLYGAFPPPDSEQAEVDLPVEKKVVNQVTDEQLDMQGFMKLLCELQKQGKITGEEFRENRSLWMQQKPNDRDVLVARLKQLLKAEAKSSDAPKYQPPPKPRKL